MQHAGLYARISQDKNGRAEGVEEQVRWGREYCGQTWPGLPVVVYAENNISGTDDDRPRLNDMRQAIRDGQCVQVVTTYHSRLSRSYIWFAMAAEMLEAGVAKIHTRHDGIVEVGGLLGDILAVINTHAVKVMKEALMDRLTANADKGEAPGSLPFGYRHGLTSSGAKTYLQVPEQAAAIRFAADKVLAGWALGRIADALTGQGIAGAHRVKVRDAAGNVVLGDDGQPVTRPTRITAQSVRNWVTLPSVAGWRAHKGVIVRRGNWDAILDQDTWQACRSALKVERLVLRTDGSEYQVGTAHRGNPGLKYLLTGGLAVCGVCGGRMAGSLKQLKGGSEESCALSGRPYRGGRSVPYLLCMGGGRYVSRARGGQSGCTGIMLELTEQYVVGRLRAEFDDPAWLAEITADEHAARRDEIGVALAAIDGQRAELAAMWGRRATSDDGLTTEEWIAAKRELAAAERELRAELEGIKPPQSVTDIAGAWAGWDGLELGEQREFLRKYIDQVTIMPAAHRGGGTPGFDTGRVLITWRPR